MISSAEADERRAATLRELVGTFLAEHADTKRKTTTARHYRSILNNWVLPELGNRKVEQVTTDDVVKIHHAMRKQPYQANRMLAVIGSLYSFAGKQHLNPARGIKKYPEKGRERFLSLEELNQLGEAIREAETTGLPYKPEESDRPTMIGPHAAAALRWLLFTGARLREILDLKWEHVDFTRGLLLLPDSKTGKKAIVLNAPGSPTCLAGAPTSLRAAIPRSPALT